MVTRCVSRVSDRNGNVLWIYDEMASLMSSFL